ncbi:MAG: TonB-dependent receptor [Pseudomonadota bacterium]
MSTQSRKFAIRTSMTALGLAMAMQGSAFAQEDASGEDGEFLGTITLGQSKREVQTSTPTAVTVIKQEEIDDRQAATIAEIIDSVPGVTLLNGNTPSGSGVNIRGFGANRIYGTDQKVAILVDGATTGAEEIYRISNQLFTDPYLYKEVEVIRGTIGSFEYASGVVGGVVRLETKDASDFTDGEVGLGGAITGGVGLNGDQYNGSATLAWQPTDRLEFLANYSYREQTNQDDGNGNEIGNSTFELPSFLLKGKVAITDEQSLMLSYTNTESADRDVPYDTFITETDFFGNVDRDIKTETASLIYEFSPIDNDLIDLYAALTYSDQQIDQTYLPFTNGFGMPSPFSPVFVTARDGFGVVNADLKFETTKFTLKNTSFIETGAIEHELRYGFEYIDRDRQDASAAPGGQDERFALFLIDVIDFGNGLTFTPALRYETQTISGEYTSWVNDATLDTQVDGEFDDAALMGGASLRYQFDNGLAFFGSYSQTSSLPIIDDLPRRSSPGGAAPTDSQLEARNRIFVAEQAETFEVGASYDRVGLFTDSDVLALKVNYYDTTLDDMTSYAGVESVETQGLEIEGSLAFEGGLYFDMNANFTDGEETLYAFNGGTTSDFRGVAQDTLRLTVGKRFSPGLDVSAEILRAEDTDIVNFAGSNPPSEVGDSYTILNLRATFSPDTGLLEGTTIRVGLENATDEAYVPNLSTRFQPGANAKLTVTKAF